MRCVAVLGPSQTGKTTLVDRLSNLEGKPQRFVTQDGPDLTRFSFLGDDWIALDCPGAIEALCHTQSALLAADAAVVCVSPDPEQAVLAAPYLRAVEVSGTPTFLFVGRIDEPRGRIRDVVAALQDYAAHPIVLRQAPIREGDKIVGAVDLISERAWRYRQGQHSDLIEIPESAMEREMEARSELLEHFSDFDDWLLEELIEDRQPAAGPLYAISSRILSASRIIPAFLGSSLNGNGITRLMKALRHEAPQVDALHNRLTAATEGKLDTPPIAVAFQAHYRQHAGKAVMLRALGEGVRQGQAVGGNNLGPLLDGAFGDGSAGNGLKPGSIGLAVKSDHLRTAHVYGKDRGTKPGDIVEFIPPMMSRILTATNDKDDGRLSTALERLAEDDPGMQVGLDPISSQFVVHVQGPLHLRALRHTLSEIFGISVEEHAPQPTFCETITKNADVHYRHRKQTGGAGQFADVKLSVRPNARGEGFSFEEVIKGGTVPSNYIPAVETGAREALDHGPLGYPVVDVHVTLTDGQYHSVDSSDFAFRTAGRMGVREALSKGVPVLLQPIHQVSVHVPSVYSGTLVPLISSLHGQVLGFDRDPRAKGWDVFRAMLPAHTLDGLVAKLRSATQGLAYYESSFDHYEELYGREAEKLMRPRQQA